MSGPGSEAGRFASTVPFYRAHRLRYPDALVAAVSRHVGLPAGGRVLDLGCGPAFLAIAFARAGHAVLAMDPELAMLAGAREEIAAAGVPVDLRQGSSTDLSPALGALDLVAMGRAFHWMDRVATLHALDGLLVPGGAVALFGDRHERTVENGWVKAFRAVLDEFSAPGGAAPRHQGPDWTGHVATLLSSPFARVETIGLWERRVLTLDDVAGRALSMSSTAPGALGERRPAFEAALRSRLAPFAGPDGTLTEVVEYNAIVARRP